MISSQGGVFSVCFLCLGPNNIKPQEVFGRLGEGNPRQWAEKRLDMIGMIGK